VFGQQHRIDQRWRVFRFIREHGSVTTREISEGTGIRESLVQRLVGQLEHAGALTRYGTEPPQALRRGREHRTFWTLAD
jgi:DNA-binding MarR family transcriptional regulator